MRRNLTNIRAYNETKIKLNKLALDLSSIQNKRVSVPEALRRISNIPNIKNVLSQDAFVKGLKDFKNG
jgi:hypothetical protein